MRNLCVFVSIVISLLVAGAKAKDNDTCGIFCETKAVNPLGLRSCLTGELEFDPSVIVDDILHVPKLVFPSDGDAYDLAREAFKNDMYPAAIVYAHSNEDVKKAIDCAVQNGHSVSARGGNHNLQGLGNMHGYVVIDTRLMCSPDDFIIDRTTLAGSKHILDQNVIGTMKLQAGCPMGVVNSAIDKYFDPSEGAMTVYSICSSISIGGFLIGGGSGDQTPYLGWGVDVLHEIDITLYDGSEVTASEEQNSDLFWALRGGGTGLGIVTDVTMKIVESPPPRDISADRRFLHVTVQFDVSDSEKANKFSEAFQHFMYDFDPIISTKFGGMGFQSAPFHFLVGHYLGSWEEFVEDWTSAGLFYENFAGPDAFESALYQSYEIQTSHSLPSKGVIVKEFDSYPEVWALRVCDAGLLGVAYDFAIRRTFNLCADLGLGDEFCNEVEGVGFGNAPSTFTISNPDCTKKEVIENLVKNGYDVNNVINRSGLHPKYVEDVIATPGNENLDIDELRLSMKETIYHGALLPKLEVEIFADIFTNVGSYFATHFQHGAPNMVPDDSTAFAQRDTGIMLLLSLKEYRDFVFKKLLQDAAYGGDASKLQGYINYLGPKGNPNWRKFYFGDNYEKLQRVKEIYDPMDVFGKPNSVELPPPSEKTGKKKSKRKHDQKIKKGKNY